MLGEPSMSGVKKLKIQANWDNEAKVWVATSDDIPGLVTEAENIPELTDKLKRMIPELLELNGFPDGDESSSEIPFELTSIKEEVAHRKAS